MPKVTQGDVSSADDLGPGEGGIVRRGLHKVACFRDEDGSRFDRYGKVFLGPSNSDLAHLELRKMPPPGPKEAASSCLTVTPERGYRATASQSEHAAAD